MKIGLLNLPLDNNYGGNLQRYALIKTLEQLGHTVTYLLCKSNICHIAGYKMIPRYIRRITKKLFIDSETEIFIEKNKYLQRIQNNIIAEQFVQNHFHCSTDIYNKEELLSYILSSDFDGIVVGSDQVWRKKIAHEYGLDTYFLDFLDSDLPIKRIAFSASLGTEENELTEDEIKRIGIFYAKFNASSVREISGKRLLESYGWNKPNAEVLLDPTFLLTKEEYITLRRTYETQPSEGDLFCYILDKTNYKMDVISKEAKKRNLNPFFASIENSTNFSIYQWLRSFEEAKFVVTDSFHGVVFSIIFNKPFHLIRNPLRGNTRFDSLFQILDIVENAKDLNWDAITKQVKYQQEKSIHFLTAALK